MIRIAAADDVLAIVDIYNQAIEDQVHANCDTPQSGGEKLLATYFAGDRRFAVLVNEAEDGAITGWGALKRFSAQPQDDRIAEVAVYVRRHHRASGLGIRLLRMLIRHAETASFHSLVAIILGENAPSLRGSQACGFEERVRIPAIANAHGHCEDIVWMQKTLAGNTPS